MKVKRENGLRGLVGSRSQTMLSLLGYSKEMDFIVKQEATKKSSTGRTNC